LLFSAYILIARRFELAWLTLAENDGVDHSQNKLLVKDAAVTLSQQHGYVFLLFFNSGYVVMVKSWVCNVRLVDYDVLERTLFVASDETAAIELSHFAPELNLVTCPENTESSSSALEYGTYTYFALTLQRLYLEDFLLKSGANIFVIEADASWFARITEHMDELINDNAIVSADDRGSRKPLISAGFMYLHYSTYDFFHRFVEKYARNLAKYRTEATRIDKKDPGEQHLLTSLLRKSWTRTVVWLDECLFARGEWYLSEEYRRRCPRPIVVQNNYVSGINNKLIRARQWGHWFLDNEGKCITKMPPVNSYNCTTCQNDQSEKV
jgi:hypothetical protein